MSVFTLVSRYVKVRTDAHEFAPTTARIVRLELYRFARSCPQDPAKISRRHVEKWLAEMNVATSTVMTRLGAVRSFCRWLVKIKVLTKDPTADVKGPKRPRRIPRAFTGQQVDQLLKHCRDARLRLVLLLMLCEGLRIGEVAVLQIGDIDTAAGTLRVIGKGDKQRVVPVTPATFAAMRLYLVESPASSGVLVRSAVDGRSALTPNYLGQMVSAEMKAAGVKEWPRDGRSAHACRHTAATTVLAAGADIRDVQFMLGHDSVLSTEIYLTMPNVERVRGPMMRRTYASPLRVLTAEA